MAKRESFYYQANLPLWHRCNYDCNYDRIVTWLCCPCDKATVVMLIMNNANQST